MNWTELRQQIVAHFNSEELITLCMDINVDYDSLGGDGKEAKVRELVGWCRRHGRLPEMIAALESQRPNVGWPDLEASTIEDAIGQGAPAGPKSKQEAGKESASSYDVEIGDVGARAQIAIGRDISQIQSTSRSSYADLFDGLVKAIKSETAGQQQKSALERCAMLKSEVESTEPDLGNLQASKDFFVKLGGEMASQVKKVFKSEPMQATLKRAAEIAIQANIDRLANGS